MSTVTRADTFTSQKKKFQYFSDFLDNFDQCPLGPELAVVTNEKAVTQSIKNLIYTNFGERVFQPNVGCNITASLFELAGVPLQNLLIQSITATIQTWEPRAILEAVTVQDLGNPIFYGQPANVDKNAIEVTIIYYLINNPKPITITVMLRRLR
jgi:phage baseplate assembly protein W